MRILRLGPFVTKEKQGLKFQCKLGDAKNCLDSSVLYCQAQQQNFWAAQKAWELTPKTSPLPTSVKMAKFDAILVFPLAVSCFTKI